MLWSARVTVQLRSLRVTSSHFSTKPDIHSSPESKVDKDCVNFLPWLERKAGVEISSNLYIGKSAHGRSLFASRRIQAGDCILKVPHNVGESGWAPYISCLPQPGDMHSTIFWSESELDMICQSLLYQQTIKVKAQLEKDFRTFEQAFQDFPGILESFTLKDFMHAFRVDAVLVCTENNCCLVVIADRDHAPHEESLGHFNPSYMRKTFALRKQKALIGSFMAEELLCNVETVCCHQCYYRGWKHLGMKGKETRRVRLFENNSIVAFWE